MTLELPTSLLKPNRNVVTVLVDYHGHDETSTGKGVENPRGILGAYLLPDGTQTATGFNLWKIQGNAGGSENIDPVRGPMNEGGLYAERLGWFLPGFDGSGKEFTTSSPLDGMSKSGVRFYTTNFHLNVDKDLDAPIGISLSSSNGTIARVMLWVNGVRLFRFALLPSTDFISVVSIWEICTSHWSPNEVPYSPGYNKQSWPEHASSELVGPNR
jgi:beta-galactosidase